MIFEDGDLFLLTCAGEAITTWELLFIFVRFCSFNSSHKFYFTKSVKMWKIDLHFIYPEQ